MKDIRINHANFNLKNGGQGVLVVLMYSGSGDPKIALDSAVRQLTDDIGYFELIDAHLDNPWTRVLMTDINDMVQEELVVEKHQLKTLKLSKNG